jgi:hypothetical protein
MKLAETYSDIGFKGTVKDGTNTTFMNPKEERATNKDTLGSIAQDRNCGQRIPFGGWGPTGLTARRFLALEAPK